MKRYEKFVFEAEDGITFDVFEGKNGELIVRALTVANIGDYSDNYDNPPIPDGYKYVSGEWNNGFVIERESDSSQFVWVPVGCLFSTGVLDNKHILEKFGRRRYQDYEFSDKSYNEELTDELLEQIESIKKYGGFYVSRFTISKSPEGKPQSIKGAMPWVSINFYDAKKVAGMIENSETVKSHLIFGAEYDSVLEWFIESGAKSFNEITKASPRWGNHWDTKDSPHKAVETGSRESWKVNNIYDFAGNVSEWTQEQYGEGFYRISRGGNYSFNGEIYSVAYRSCEDPDDGSVRISFRAALYIK